MDEHQTRSSQRITANPSTKNLAVPKLASASVMARGSRAGHQAGAQNRQRGVKSL